MKLEKTPVTTSKETVENIDKVTVVSQPSAQHLDGVNLPDVGSPAEAYKTYEAGTSMVDEAIKEACKDIKPTTEDVQQATKVAESTMKERVRSGQVLVSQLDPKVLDDFMAECWIARPLRQNSLLDVKSKDPNFRMRWVEFKSQGGANYNDRLAAGFVNARPEECVGLSSDILITSDGIRHHDLILMKIPTATINGWLKYNALRSMALAQRGGAMKAANAAANKQLREGLMSEGVDPQGSKFIKPDGTPKIEIYSPGEASSVGA